MSAAGQRLALSAAVSYRFEIGPQPGRLDGDVGAVFSATFTWSQGLCRLPGQKSVRGSGVRNSFLVPGAGSYLPSPIKLAFPLCSGAGLCVFQCVSPLPLVLLSRVLSLSVSLMPSLPQEEETLHKAEKHIKKPVLGF